MKLTLILPLFLSLDSMCVLGKRLLKDIDIGNCTKDIDGILWKEFCNLNNNTGDSNFYRNPEVYRTRENNWNCDPYFQGTLHLHVETHPITVITLYSLSLFLMCTANNISIVQGIKGLSSGVFFENLKPGFLDVSEENIKTTTPMNVQFQSHFLLHPPSLLTVRSIYCLRWRFKS